MKLTDIVKQPDVRAVLKPLRPKIPRKIDAPLLVQPRSSGGIVGTAFDYLFRFELQRRMPHAQTRDWVAERAPMKLRVANIKGSKLEVHLPGGSRALSPPGGFERAARRAEKVLNEAQDAVAEYVVSQHPNLRTMEELAGHAVRLAKLDLVYRAGILDTGFAEAEQEEVHDLLAMLSLVPWSQFGSSDQVLVNPTFGEASVAIGGADADCIIGDLLVDLKTSKADSVSAEYLDQLLGYYILARIHRKTNRRFPEVRRVALYFARRSHLLTIDTECWTSTPGFEHTTRWFFQRACAE